MNSKSIFGTCVEVGDDDKGQPRLVIITTREQIKALTDGVLYRFVQVMPVEIPPTQP